MTVLVIAPDGTTTEHELPAAETDSLRFLQTHVEGYIELVRITDDLDMWMPDDASGKDRNLIAEAIAQHETGHQLRQQLFGTAVLACHDDKGRTTPLTEAWLERLQQYRMPVYGFIMIPPTTLPRRQ